MIYEERWGARSVEGVHEAGCRSVGNDEGR